MLNYFDIILNKMQFDKMVKGQVFRATTQKLITEKNGRTIIKFQVYLL